MHFKNRIKQSINKNCEKFWLKRSDGLICCYNVILLCIKKSHNKFWFLPKNAHAARKPKKRKFFEEKKKNIKLNI